MNRWIALGAAAMAAFGSSVSSAAAADSRCFELRIYYAAPGKLDDLHQRFRNHTVRLFEKHGMQNVGYWVPIQNTDSRLIYLLAYPSRPAREESWKGFMGDPDWQAAFKTSETNGPLVQKMENYFLTATDYSPAIISPAVSQKSRVFELRDYTAAEGRLAPLNARFRDHTLKLFEKHGMHNLGYWTPMAGDPGSENRLIYLLSHDNTEAARASFAAFGQDPDWKTAREASEKDAGGSLTVPGGVKSTFLVATDYSPTR